MQKNSAARFVLEKIGELGTAGLEAFFPRHYAYTRMWRPLLGLDKSRAMSRRTFSAMMSRLVRQGLVERLEKQNRSVWSLTKAGAVRIADSRQTDAHAPKSDGITRLVIFVLTFPNVNGKNEPRCASN